MQAIFEHRVPAATITFIDSLVETPYHWESVKTYSYLEGMGTPNDYYDDLFAINGESSGLDIAGVSFSAVTEEALGNYLGCRWIRTGKTLLSIPGLAAPSGYIEYIGEDTCTNLVMYSFNGNPFFDKFTFH